MFKEAILVGCGAGLGALARFLLGEVVPDQLLITLIINILGCFFMGIIGPRPFAGTGFLGGFSTMSAFALLSITLPIIPALGYVFITAASCVAAVLLGRAIVSSRRQA